MESGRKYLSFLASRREDSKTQVWTLNRKGGEAEQLTEIKQGVPGYEWSPDRTKIAFVSNRTENPDANSNSDIWIIDVDNADKGENLIQVTTNPGSDRSPAWSPDGNFITHVSVIDTSVIWYATNHLAMSPSNGSGEMNILTESLDRNVRNPEFSDDGRSILFLLENRGESQLASIRTN